MNFEEIQRLWNTAPSGQIPAAADGAELLARVKDDNAKFEATIRRRDRREVAAAAVYATTFALAGAVARHEGRTVWPFAAAAAIMALIGGFILAEKSLAKRLAGPAKPTLVGELEATRRHVSRQIRLLENVLWWYIIPAQVAWLLFYTGLALAALSPLAFALAPWWIWSLSRGGMQALRLNRKAVEADLRPRRRELDALLASFQVSDHPGS